MPIFYEVKDVPIHSVLLLPTREKALNYPKRDIKLGFCRTCGFIANVAFDESLHEYSDQYEATQGYSATFNTFHKQLAGHLIEKYHLRDKDIIEIGCGQGEFLKLLCSLGNNRGTGFDPAYIDSFDGDEKLEGQLAFIRDFYSERYAHYQGDFICCKMTLEHIPHTAEFVSMVRRSAGNRVDTIVFFQVPNVTRILRDLAFWDIYYEHCSYFSRESLSYLFWRSGFKVIDITTAYDDQYLMIEAIPGNASESFNIESKNPDFRHQLEILAGDVAHFSKMNQQRLDKWREFIQGTKREDKRVVIWGSGSKGVAFLQALNIRDEISYTVDINPRKHGTFMAGTGQEIVAPSFLTDYQPDIVIMMNPVYNKEIQRELELMGIKTRLMSV
jgi:hypothetical protein